MIDFQLFIINLLCIIGASFLIFVILTQFKLADTTKAGLSVFIGCIVVIVLYCWINVPKLACDVCMMTNIQDNKLVCEQMSNFNNDTPKFVSEQDGLIIPENIHGTMRTDINLDKFLKYGYMSKQLKEAMLYQKMYGGTNPPPSMTATTQIVPPFSDVVIPVETVLLMSEVPEAVSAAKVNSQVAEIEDEIATTESDQFEVPASEVSAIEAPAGNLETFTSDVTKVLLFFNPYCGYCKDFMKAGGVWESVKGSVKEFVDIIEVNSEINPQMCREFNVQYYPCLMKVKNNNIYEFTDARTFVNVQNFCLE